MDRSTHKSIGRDSKIEAKDREFGEADAGSVCECSSDTGLPELGNVFGHWDIPHVVSSTKIKDYHC